jgi:adenine deaminase
MIPVRFPRRFILSILLFLPLPGFHPAAGAQDLVIQGGYFFDSIGDEIQKNGGIVIKSGRFFSVGKVPEGLDTAEFETLRLSEEDYILPGIFDMHAHYRVTFKRKRSSFWPTV